MDLDQLTISRVQKKELESFFTSAFYQLLKHIPLTELRLKSYQNNPFADAEDYILYYIAYQGQIISYRTLLFDEMLPGQKVVWSSGSWTDANYRQKGLSKKLLKAVEADYPQQSIIYTQSIASKKLYDRTESFHAIIDRESKELHYDLSILERKLPSSLVKIMNGLIPQKKRKLPFKSKFEKYSVGQQNISDFLNAKSHNKIFSLTQPKLDWILSYPWIGQNTYIKEGKMYDFSLEDSTFQSDCYLSHTHQKINALMVRNIRRNAYYLHYAFYENNAQAKEIAQFIVNEMIENQLTVLIIRDSTILKWVKKYHKPLFIKPYKNFMFVSDALYQQVINNKFQHGIGELIFT